VCSSDLGDIGAAAGSAQLAGQAIEGIGGTGTFQDYLKSLGAIQQTNMLAQAGLKPE